MPPQEEVAMLKRILVLAATFSLLATAGALAAYDQYYPVNDYAPGSNGFLSAEVVMGILVLVIAGVLLDSNFGGNGGSSDDSHSTDTAEHYEQEALRLRAYARKLDAETAAKETGEDAEKLTASRLSIVWRYWSALMLP
jgi:hypothetical protein